MTRCRAFIRTLALCAAIAAAAAAAVPAMAASATPTKGQAASGWLARQMTNRSHFVFVSGGKTFPDQGLTIDAIFAFAATGTANDYGRRATAWLERPAILSNYIGNGTTESFAGETAKVALAAEVRGLNPESFGKVNLLARLAKLLTKSGRYSDHSSFGDFSSPFTQALAILAVSRHGHTPARAVNFLIGSECANGGFPANFGEKTCVSDPDTTGLAVQALLAVGRTAPAARGVHWLARTQRSNGGFATSATANPNANSTGLAGEALAAAHLHRRAALARNFLLSLQVGCSATASHRGAIAFDKTGFKESTAVVATPQAVLGIADIALSKLSSRGALDGAPRLSCPA